MLDFRPVTLDDSTLLRRLLGGEGRICDSTAGTVLMWRRYFDTRIAFAGETAVLRASYRGRDVFTRPFGPDPDGAVGAIIDFARENSLPAEFGFLDEESAKHLAERFGASLISCVLSIDNIDLEEGTVTAVRELENGLETVKAKLPCLITVEKTNFRPRIPNLSQWKVSRTAEILSYNSRSIPGLDFSRIGDPGSPTKVPRTYPPEAGEPGAMIDEGSAEANAAKLASLLADVL